MKILLELRPALDGHAGIPQETRLLFRGLSRLPDVEVEGLIQSSNLVVSEGLPMEDGRIANSLSPDRNIDRMSRVVISLQQGAVLSRPAYAASLLRRLGTSAGIAARVLSGRRQPLTGFDPTHFKDFVWRSLFAKSLPEADFESVTSRPFRILGPPCSLAHATGVATHRLGRALYPRLDTTGADVLLAETPFPGRVSGRTRMVVRYHDAIPLLMPHTIINKTYHQAAHYHALRRNAADGAWFACVSDATRRDLLSVFPQVEARAVTIPNMVSHHFFEEASPAERVPEIIWARKNRTVPVQGGAPISPADLVDGRLSYLLMVSTMEPRKNHRALLDAWQFLRTGPLPRLNLVFVGSLGWDHDAIISKCKPWLERGGLHLLEDVPSEDLRLLYRHARATVCPSFSEGFDFPGIEAMRCGGVVAASDIPVHRDVFADASEYFSPYSPTEMAQTLARIAGEEAHARRTELVERGREVSALYLPERVLSQWQSFLAHVTIDPSGRRAS